MSQSLCIVEPVSDFGCILCTRASFDPLHSKSDGADITPIRCIFQWIVGSHLTGSHTPTVLLRWYGLHTIVSLCSRSNVYELCVTLTQVHAWYRAAYFKRRLFH